MFTAENVLSQLPDRTHNQRMRVLFAFQLLGSDEADKIEVLQNFNTVILTKSSTAESNHRPTFDLRRSQQFLVNSSVFDKLTTKRVIFSLNQ